jgi:hypothetical protein
MSVLLPTLPIDHDEFVIQQTQMKGGGWMLEWKNSGGTSLFAFTTLDNARRYVAEVTGVDKRVRLTKHSSVCYSYRHG